MEKLLEGSFTALGRFPIVQLAVAIVVLAVAGLMIRSALRERSTPPAPPPATPIQIESPWLIQHLVEMHLDIVQTKKTMDLMSGQLAGIVSLLKRRQRKRPKT